jgi:hypothetical protein
MTVWMRRLGAKPPHPGDRWRMHLYRVEARPSPAELAWSPTLEADFHRPNRFGELVFTDRVATPDPPRQERLP